MKKLFILFVLVAALFAPALWAAPQTLTPTAIVVTGTTLTLAAPTSNDTLQFANDGTAWLDIANSGTQKTLTIVSQVSDYMTLPAGVAASNGSVTIPATTGRVLIGPFLQTSWNDRTTGYVTVILSDTTGITLAAFKLDMTKIGR